jgi:hypothetical protein
VSLWLLQTVKLLVTDESSFHIKNFGRKSLFLDWNLLNQPLEIFTFEGL